MENWGKIIRGDSRSLKEIPSQSIQLIVTSPPYWSIKDYQVPNQIGYRQTLHQYLTDLYRVWQECYRVLEPGRKLIINVGDQFLRASQFGKYKVVPLHGEIIVQCEQLGFDYMGSIIWQKKTTMNTSGGATLMGSYPYPPNGVVEIDYEFILIFKKPGKSRPVPKEIKEKSRLTKEEWKEYFSGHWYFGGVKQREHQAMFPEELPRRLIKMFSFVGETVLDPFLGSGTTLKVALELGRNGIGYEINPNYLEIIKQKVGYYNLINPYSIEIIQRDGSIPPQPVEYVPNLKDISPPINSGSSPKKNYKRVKEVRPDGSIKLEDGTVVRFCGVEIVDLKKAIQYLKRFVVGKEITLKEETATPFSEKEGVEGYVYLKNGIFINAYLIKSGIGKACREREYQLKQKFLNMEEEREKELL